MFIPAAFQPGLLVTLKQTSALLQNDFFLNAFLNLEQTSFISGRIKPQVFLTSAEATAFLLSCKTDKSFPGSAGLSSAHGSLLLTGLLQ